MVNQYKWYVFLVSTCIYVCFYGRLLLNNCLFNRWKWGLIDIWKKKMIFTSVVDFNEYGVFFKVNKPTYLPIVIYCTCLCNYTSWLSECNDIFTQDRNWNAVFFCMLIIFSNILVNNNLHMALDRLMLLHKFYRIVYVAVDSSNISLSHLQSDIWN